jgi:hypothetical protein
MFANGTHYGIFIEKNCCKCSKYMNSKGEFTCKIEESITIANFENGFPLEIDVDEMTCKKFKDGNGIIRTRRKPLKNQITIFDLIKEAG